MPASPNHVKITDWKSPNKTLFASSIKTPRRTTGRWEGEPKHASLYSAHLQQNRLWRKEKGNDSPTRRRDLARRYAKYCQHASFPRVTRSLSFLPSPPPRPSQGEAALSSLALSVRPKEPAYRHAPRPFTPFPTHLAPIPTRGDRPSLALRPPPRVRVRACPWGSPLSPLRKAAGPHLHPRQARLHGGVSHGGGRDAVRREPGLLRRFQGTGLSSCPHSPAHGIFPLLLLALPPSEAAPVRRRRERGRPKLGLFRPPSRMQRRRPPPPPHHPSSSPGRACQAAVTGAVARSRQRDDKPEGRRQGRRRQRRCARPASPTRLPAHAASPGPRSHTHTHTRHHR